MDGEQALLDLVDLDNIGEPPEEVVSERINRWEDLFDKYSSEFTDDDEFGLKDLVKYSRNDPKVPPTDITRSRQYEEYLSQMGDQALEVATQYGNIDPASDEEDIGDKDEGESDESSEQDFFQSSGLSTPKSLKLAWKPLYSAEANSSISSSPAETPPSAVRLAARFSGTEDSPLNSAGTPRLNGSSTPRLNSSSTPRGNGSSTPRLNGSSTSRLSSSSTPRLLAAKVAPKSNDMVDSPLNSAGTPRINGSSTPRLNVSSTPRLNSSSTPRRLAARLAPKSNGIDDSPLNSVGTPPLGGSSTPRRLKEVDIRANKEGSPVSSKGFQLISSNGSISRPKGNSPLSMSRPDQSSGKRNFTRNKENTSPLTKGNTPCQNGITPFSSKEGTSRDLTSTPSSKGASARAKQSTPSFGCKRNTSNTNKSTPTSSRTKSSPLPKRSMASSQDISSPRGKIFQDKNLFGNEVSDENHFLCEQDRSDKEGLNDLKDDVLDERVGSLENGSQKNLGPNKVENWMCTVCGLHSDYPSCLELLDESPGSFLCDDCLLESRHFAGCKCSACSDIVTRVQWRLLIFDFSLRQKPSTN